MIDKLISFSIHNKLIVGLLVAAIIGWGMYSVRQLPIDAVPDITTNQVQILTQCPTLATQEVEQFVTFPIEIAIANLPDVVEIRSISRFGISVVTVVFDEHVDIYLARQLISERLERAIEEIPAEFGRPELGPITTGLGEVYQYILHTEPGYDSMYTDMDLRTINDWIVKRQLAGTPGVIEVSSWGGHLKQYEVAVSPKVLNAMHITIADVYEALERNNENMGGSYIEKRYNTYFIRGEGLVQSLDDVREIVVKTVNGIPVLIRDIAKVGFGSAPRYGAITWNGKGEVVGGMTLMLKGENSYEVVHAVKERIETIRKSLPEGVVLESYLDRSELIGRAVSTVTENLIMGGLIVIFVLILLLGNIRGGLIVASTIPLSMLAALGLMNIFGVSANLMSLGAIDFGIIVDGAVIIVESVVFYLSTHFVRGQKLSQHERDDIAQRSSSKMMRSAFFGQLIILIVFIPILTLTGIEGKMFRPMAQTVSFAMIGAIVLSLTYVPMMSALFLRVSKSEKKSFADRLVGWLNRTFEPVLRAALHVRWLTLGIAVILLAGSAVLYTRLGGEFIPTLEEGDFALHQILPPGSSLQQSIEVSGKIQKTLLEEFPEVETAVSKIGTAEVPTDPMPIEVGDVIVKMKPKQEWVTASSREEMFVKMEEVLSKIPGVQYEFTQPIQMRFNELIAGIREDIAIKIFGENLDILFQKANEAERLISDVEGIGDMRVEQTQGLPQMVVRYDRSKVAQYGLDIKDLNRTLRTAFAGGKAGVVFEGERRFDLVVRLEEDYRRQIEDIRSLFIPMPNGQQIPLKEIAGVEFVDGPMQISREDTKRRITIGINARGRDIESLVGEISDRLDAELQLPPGYYIEYGGTFENLKEAKERLSIAVPVALLLIFVLVFFALNSLKQTIMIYMSIPLAAMGGIFLLWLRDMPFSISAGVGFIVLSGVAVLNGLVLISSLNELKAEGTTGLRDLIVRGTKRRIRPILLTASTDVLGFLPMAISTSAGAEVQRPLATVVIGGLVTATMLTLIVLPVLYSIFERSHILRKGGKAALSVALLVLCAGGFMSPLNAQSSDTLTLEQAVQIARENHPSMRAASLEVAQQDKLQNATFDLGKTQFSGSVGELDAPSLIDYHFQITQRFKFPTVYLAQSDLQRAKTALSEQARTVTALELERNVRSAWWRLAYGRQRLSLLDKLAGTYRTFSEVAVRRFRAGEGTLLEKTSAESQYQQIVLQTRQASADIAIYRRQLQQWLGSDSTFFFKEDTLDQIMLPLELPPMVDENPVIRYFRQNTQVAGQSATLERKRFLPDLSIGYFIQQVEGVGGLDGIQFGVGIPLYFWSQRANVEAAEIGREIAQAEYEDNLRMMTSRYETKQQEAIKYMDELQWYESQGLRTADEMIRVAERSYRAGESGYLEYFTTTNEAIQIKTDYLDVLHKYRQAIVELQYLSGSFE